MRLRMIATAAMSLLAIGIGRAADPPRLAKSFVLPADRAFVNPGETTTLVFTITNPNTTTNLTGLDFTDILPPGLVIAALPGVTNSCGGAVTAPPGGTTIHLFGGTLGAAGLTAPNSCVVSVRVTALTLGAKPGVTTPVISVEGGPGAPASASLLVAHSLFVGYAANLNRGDSVINMTNTGTQTTAAGTLTNICANVYAFSPDEQMISCCSCLLSDSELTSLSQVEDVVSNTLTPVVPNSIVVKMVATYGAACNASAVSEASIASGLAAWMTRLHALPTSPATYGVTETGLAQVALSPAELARITSFCGFIQANGSGYGICRSCRLGALGANKK